LLTLWLLHAGGRAKLELLIVAAKARAASQQWVRQDVRIKIIVQPPFKRPVGGIPFGWSDPMHDSVCFFEFLPVIAKQVSGSLSRLCPELANTNMEPGRPFLTGCKRFDEFS